MKKVPCLQYKAVMLSPRTDIGLLYIILYLSESGRKFTTPRNGYNGNNLNLHSYNCHVFKVHVFSMTQFFWRFFFSRAHSHFGATGTPIVDFWWRLLWVSKPERFSLIREVNVMFTPKDPPLVLHIANLLAVSIVGQQFQTTAQCCHLLVHSTSLGLELNPGHVWSSTTCYHYAMPVANIT